MLGQRHCGWTCGGVRVQARYAWAPPAFNPNLTSSSSSGLLASLKDKVKRIRYSAPTTPCHPCLAPSSHTHCCVGHRQLVAWSISCGRRCGLAPVLGPVTLLSLQASSGKDSAASPACKHHCTVYRSLPAYTMSCIVAHECVDQHQRVYTPIYMDYERCRFLQA